LLAGNFYALKLFALEGMQAACGGTHAKNQTISKKEKAFR